MQIFQYKENRIRFNLIYLFIYDLTALFVISIIKKGGEESSFILKVKVGFSQDTEKWF